MASSEAFETEEAFEEALKTCETKEDYLKLILGPVDARLEKNDESFVSRRPIRRRRLHKGSKDESITT